MKSTVKTFSGLDRDQERLDVFQWVRMVEITATCYDWDKKRKLAIAVIHLEGPAAAWVDTLGDLDQLHWPTF